ncbi:MAG: Fpg/Nei family DNA glycosylase [Actinobacteria bacterium]|nr:MAG: Fpg/Nei family DNA glycosylase [Actinomycetota bacterium]
MPEGHTIHLAAREQTKLLTGRTVHVSSPQGRFTDASRIDGATLERVEAYGKHLFYHWDTGEVGHVHLGLFGKYRVTIDPELMPPVGLVRMRLRTETDDGQVVTVDLSGPTACSVDDPSTRDGILARLGPDPLRRNSDPRKMIDRIRKSERGIGDLLMDQSVVAGVGNVYRAEALFVQGIHPLRPGSSFDHGELQQLWDTTRRMLRKGVTDGRIITVTREDLGFPRGKRIEREDATYAYKRDRCLRCGDDIRRIEIANRTCYYCPTDQPR